MTKDNILSILGCVDSPPGAHVLRESEGYPAALERLWWPASTGGNPGCLMNGGMCGRLSC